METKNRMEKRQKSIIGGYNLELMESLRYGTKAIMIRVEGEGIFEPR